MKLILTALCGVVFLTGCSTPSIKTVHVSEPRPAIPLSSVKFVSSAPTGAICVADILATARNSSCGAESAQVAIKKQAAAVGAPFVVLDNWDAAGQLLGIPDEFRIEGHAFALP